MLWVTLWAVVASLVVLGGVTAMFFTRDASYPSPSKPPPDAKWRAEVRTAQRYNADRYMLMGMGMDTRIEDLRGEVSVRITRGGSDFLTVGIVKADDEQFEDVLHSLVAQAQDRAATLNAVNDLIVA